MSSGRFKAVIDDTLPAKRPERVLCCSGKIYYELRQRQQDLERTDVAIVRLEQFYPFPEVLVTEIAARYASCKQWCWVQEEPENMGGWRFVRPLLENLIGRPLQYIGRPAAASPATGFPMIYRRQQAAITDEAVGPAG